MNNGLSDIKAFLCITLLLLSSRVIAQPGSQNFDKVWMQGESIIYTTTFNGTNQPYNQLIKGGVLLWFAFGHSNICDSAGNLLLVSDGYTLYNKNLDTIEGGNYMSPKRVINFNDGWNPYSQSSIILPFGNGKYRLITPTVSDDSCYYNWEHVNNGALYDLLLYDEIDMNANGGAGKVTKRMVPLLENVRLSKTQMMACRHGDGKSWWLLKNASDTNLIYKFLLTADTVYGPFIQGFSGEAAYLGFYDLDGQAMFSQDGTKYATTINQYGHVFIADFDRCTGMLSNPKVYDVPDQEINSPGLPILTDNSTDGLAFSPNGRYLYVSGDYYVQQFDLQNPTSPNAWTLLSGPDTIGGWFMEYSNIYPGPDAKLYIGNWGFSSAMNVIDSPDKGGTAAAFCRRCLRFPGIYDTTDSMYYYAVSSPPCMPNYRLGAVSPKCAPVSVYELVSNEVQFSLYPNPAKGGVELSYNEAGTLFLYDMTGRIVVSWLLPFSASGRKSISLDAFSTGLYQYKYVSKQNGAFKAGKLVITR